MASAETIRLRDRDPSARAVRRRIAQREQLIRDGVDRPLRILLVGRTGVGKSSTINSLLGLKIAKVGDHEPQTAEIHSYRGTIGAAHVQVVDTPGFCDDHPGVGNDERYVKQIEKFVGEVDLLLFATMLDEPAKPSKVLPVEVLDPDEPLAVVVDGVTTERRQGGVRIVETTFTVPEGRGTIVINGGQAKVVQHLVEQKAPSLFRQALKAGAGLLWKVRRALGF